MENVIEINISNSFTAEAQQNSDKAEEILILDGESTFYNEFFLKCLIPNNPCIIKNVGKDWPCFRTWITDEKKPNFDYLEHYKDNVSVAQCNKQIYNVQEKLEMTLSDYLTYWRAGCQSTAKCLYLKDWHFMKNFPEANVYRVPKFFSSDWLGEHYDRHPELTDDYRFVYMGPKGSWTPLHVDVFSSYSWSINVTGRKRWLLMRPEVDCIFRDSLGNLLFDKNLQVPENILGIYDIQQEAGEAIFIPSGWHHQVWNLEDTISINHNWVNGTNIRHMWDSMRINLTKVKAEIKDCRTMEDWDAHCQLMLKALYGINYPQFCDFLAEIAESRMVAIENSRQLSVFGGWYLGKNYLLYDLSQVLAILEQFVGDVDVCNAIFQSTEVKTDPNDLKLRLDAFMNKFKS